MNAPETSFPDGEAYERMMGRWSQSAGAIFLDWLKPAPGLRWLDVGCGTGAFTELLIAHAAPAAVAAVDPSEGQLAYARRRASTHSATFRQGDAQALPFADDSFDAAAMALVICFVPDAGKAVTEMRRVTRPGGCVATYIWDVPGGGVPVQPVFAALQAMGFTPPMPPGAELTRREALERLWRQAGLDAVETREIRIPVTHASFDAFWEANSVPVGPQGKLISGLSGGQRDELRDRLRGQLSAGADGRIAYEAFANAVKGRVPG